MITPSKEQALHLALLLGSGMPSYDAIRYFLPPDEPNLSETTVKNLHDSWLKSSALKAAILQVQGKAWQDMGMEEKIQFAINKHYTELAYFLYSHNYVDTTGTDLTKINQARQVLEAKIAGMAGKMDALTRFWDDVTTGKVKLTAVPAAKMAGANGAH